MARWSVSPRPGEEARVRVRLVGLGRSRRCERDSPFGGEGRRCVSPAARRGGAGPRPRRPEVGARIRIPRPPAACARGAGPGPRGPELRAQICVRGGLSRGRGPASPSRPQRCGGKSLNPSGRVTGAPRPAALGAWRPSGFGAALFFRAPQPRVPGAAFSQRRCGRIRAPPGGGAASARPGLRTWVLGYRGEKWCLPSRGKHFDR